MKKKVLHLMIVNSLMLSSIANADGSLSPSPLHQGGAYFGISLGSVIYNDACATSANSCDDNTFGIGLYGGYQFNHWFALEGGITSYGEVEGQFSSSNVKANVMGSELTAKLNYPLAERLDVFTRLGVAYQHTEKSFSTSDDYDNSDWGMLTAVGLSYQIAKNWSVRGEYQFTGGIDDTNSDIHFTSMGVTYHFGNDDESRVESQLVEEETLPQEPQEPPEELVTEPQVVRYVTLDKPATIRVAHDSAALISSSEINKLAEQMREFPEDELRLVGHTDSTGAAAYNQRLSEQRAQGVADELVNRGTERSRLKVIGMGELSPKATNATAEGRAENRRVDVYLEPSENNNKSTD